METKYGSIGGDLPLPKLSVTLSLDIDFGVAPPESIGVGRMALTDLPQAWQEHVRTALARRAESDPALRDVLFSAILHLLTTDQTGPQAIDAELYPGVSPPDLQSSIDVP